MALVLERCPGEVIWIGDDVRVIVLKTRGERVWLAIDAPKSVVVDREEVRIAKQRWPNGKP